jgi:hypothetical protein
MLREGKITDAHRSGDKLNRQPLGSHNYFYNSIWLKSVVIGCEWHNPGEDK